MKKLKIIAFKQKAHFIVLILISLLAYINIFNNGFAWDDKDFLIDWTQIKSEQGLPAYLSIPDLIAGDLPLTHRGVYRPLRSIYYVVSYAMWGLNPFGYHLQAILIHILIILVVYLITELIFKKALLAFIVSLLFAIHPIHTEAVTYITASFDTIGILFFFLSFYFYLRLKKEKYKQGIYLIASIIYALFAFFTYEMTLVLPILIVFYDFCNNKYAIKKLFPKIIIYEYYFLSLSIYLLVRFNIFQIGNRADYLGLAWEISTKQARVNLPEIFIHYLSWLFWPVNLSIFHQPPLSLLIGHLKILNRINPSGQLENLSANISIIYPVLYILGALFLVYLLLRSYPKILFGVGWFIITLIPVASIIPQGTIMAERFLYIPSYGFIFLLGWFFYNNFLKSFTKYRFKIPAYLLLSCFAILIFFYSYLTISRNNDWYDEKTIWQSAIKINPTNSFPIAALASVYAREEQYDIAIDLYINAFTVDPGNPTVISDLGLAYEKKGDIEKAIMLHKKALAYDSTFYPSHIYLGNIYFKQKKFDLAKQEYQSALRYQTNNAVLLTYIGDTYFIQQKYNQALSFYKKAFSISKTPYQPLFKIGLVYLKQSNLNQAKEKFKKSLSLNPYQYQVYIGLANVYRQEGDIKSAIKSLQVGLDKSKNQILQTELDRMKKFLNDSY